MDSIPRLPSVNPTAMFAVPVIASPVSLARSLFLVSFVCASEVGGYRPALPTPGHGAKQVTVANLSPPLGQTPISRQETSLRQAQGVV